MPKKLEAILRADAKRKGYDEERTNRYVYGTLGKIKAKGEKPK